MSPEKSHFGGRTEPVGEASKDLVPKSPNEAEKGHDAKWC